MQNQPTTETYQVRKANPSDLKGLIQLRLKLHKNYPDSWLQTYEEVALRPSSYWDSWFSRYMYDPRNILFVAVNPEGLVVGMVAGLRSEFQRARHVATVIGLGVVPEAKGKGVGKELMKRLIEWAQGEPEVCRLDLEVFSDVPAVEFYKKMGFKIEGTREKFAKRSDGRFQAAHDMVLFIKN